MYHFITFYRIGGQELDVMMASGSKPQIVTGMDNPEENNRKQDRGVSRFREVLPQVRDCMTG
jgi:hypothetical protein